MVLGGPYNAGNRQQTDNEGNGMKTKGKTPRDAVKDRKSGKTFNLQWTR